jgi:hypothetical protein
VVVDAQRSDECWRAPTTNRWVERKQCQGRAEWLQCVLPPPVIFLLYKYPGHPGGVSSWHLGAISVLVRYLGSVLLQAPMLRPLRVAAVCSPALSDRAGALLYPPPIRHHQTTYMHWAEAPAFDWPVDLWTSRLDRELYGTCGQVMVNLPVPTLSGLPPTRSTGSQQHAFQRQEEKKSTPKCASPGSGFMSTNGSILISSQDFFSLCVSLEHWPISNRLYRRTALGIPKKIPATSRSTASRFAKNSSQSSLRILIPGLSLINAFTLSTTAHHKRATLQ